MPAGTLVKTTVLLIPHVPTCIPSGLQTDLPGLVQELAEDPAPLPVDPAREEPVEGEPVDAGAGACAVASDAAADATEAIALMTDCVAFAAPGAPGGGIATMEVTAGDAAPVAEEADPGAESEPSPETEGVPESPAGPLGEEPDALAAGEVPVLPELDPPELALPQLPVNAFEPSSSFPTFATDLPGSGKTTEDPA